MKHLDALFDELQEPIAPLMDWCDDDKDRAVVACLRDLMSMKDGIIFEVFREVEGDEMTNYEIAECIILS